MNCLLSQCLKHHHTQQDKMMGADSQVFFSSVKHIQVININTRERERDVFSAVMLSSKGAIASLGKSIQPISSYKVSWTGLLSTLLTSGRKKKTKTDRESHELCILTPTLLISRRITYSIGSIFHIHKLTRKHIKEHKDMDTHTLSF